MTGLKMGAMSAGAIEEPLHDTRSRGSELVWVTGRVLMDAYVAAYLESLLNTFTLATREPRVPKEVRERLAQASLGRDPEAARKKILLSYYIMTGTELASLLHTAHRLRLQALKANNMLDQYNALLKITNNALGKEIIIDSSVHIDLNKNFLKPIHIIINIYMKRLEAKEGGSEPTMKEALETMVALHHKLLCDRAMTSGHSMIKEAYEGLAYQYIVEEPPTLAQDGTCTSLPLPDENIKNSVIYRRYVSSIINTAQKISRVIEAL